VLSSAGANATAIGNLAVASAQNSTAVGKAAVASSSFATAVGNTASASKLRSTAVGDAAVANNVSTTALGAHATTTADNQVAIGGADSSVRIGDIDASDAVQFGPEQFVTIDAAGTLGVSNVASAASVNEVRVNMAYLAAVSDAQFDALSGRVGTLETGLAATNFRLDELNQDARRGIAAAMAQADAPMPSAAGKTSYTGTGAVYRGELAFSLGLTHRLNTEAPFALMASLSHSGGDNTGATVGFAGEF
jgi:autotransporter adhesin